MKLRGVKEVDPGQWSTSEAGLSLTDAIMTS
jgi:hypothetical protein